MRDKSFEWRMEGMIYAYNIARKEGVDALEREIRKRGILKAPMRFTQKQIDEFWRELSLNVYNNMLASFAYALHVGFGFGKERLQRLKKIFDEKVKNTIDLDWMGDHYVKLEDYALEMNEKYDLGLDIIRIAACQDVHDERENKVERFDRDHVIKELRDAGFVDASEFLKKKIS